MPRTKQFDSRPHDPITGQEIGLSLAETSRLRRRFALGCLAISLGIVGLCFLSYQREARQAEQTARDREVTRVGLIGRLFGQDFRDTAADVLVLAESDDLDDCLDRGTPAAYNRFAREMLHRIHQQTEYDQIRYVDQTGAVRIRVSRREGIATPASRDSVRNQAYFSKVSALAAGQIYISAMSLSENADRIDYPLKPIMRVGTPVFDSAGNRRGILVINYLGATLLNRIRELSPATQHHMRVLNAQGYWIWGMPVEEEWGFQIPGGADHTLAHTEPALWRSVQSMSDGQLPRLGGWFTWQHVTPNAVVGRPENADSFLIVVSELPDAEWAALVEGRRRLYIFLAAILVAATAGTGWLSYNRRRERERAEQALRLARDAAQESTRLKAEFLANMSHEIRTPMNGVFGMIGLLLDTPLTSEQRNFANTVRNSAETLLKIINDILDLSKIEAGQLVFEQAPFEVRDPVENCLSLLAERAHAKGLELAYLVEENVPNAIVGDSSRLQQVLLNLVSNAVKFTPKGEVILRVASEGESDRRVRLRFTVRDTGIGIAPEVQSKLFQPFVQADTGTTRKFGGTGLGLAICRQLVTQMGGSIAMTSSPGGGTTVSFTAEFPLTEMTPKLVLPRADLAGLRGLVVDDNETNRDILVRQLGSWRVQARAVAGGAEALAALREAAASGEPFEFAILDMQMPERSGLEVAEAIHVDPELEATKMIILTSIGTNPARARLDGAGIGAYLSKPTRQSQLYDALANLFGGADVRLPEAPVEAFPPGTIPNADVKLRILVAEDNPVNQHVARLQLEKFGYRPDIVGSGQEAIDATAQETYDLVLMDCHMPGVDGYEATRQIREREARQRAAGEAVPALRIIAMTANAMVGDREACLAAGMEDYISKPVRSADLAAALARAQIRTGT